MTNVDNLCGFFPRNRYRCKTTTTKSSTIPATEVNNPKNNEMAVNISTKISTWYPNILHPPPDCMCGVLLEAKFQIQSE